MSGHSWVVGATGQCDIVVNEPPVSSRHCQITRTADGFVLKDLGSTNGTYVNGQRISNPRLVSESDRITLGKTTPLPWPSHLLAPGCRTIRIGSGADNHVVLDGEGIAEHHAQLTLHGRLMTLEDLGSGAGTAVGAPGQEITRTTVKIGDTVYLGSTALPVASLIGGKHSGKAEAESGTVTTAEPTGVVAGDSYGMGTIIAAAVGGAFVIALSLSIVIYATRGDDSPRESANGEQAASMASAASGSHQQTRPDEPPKQSRINNGTSEVDPQAPNSAARSPAASAETTRETRLSDALYLVLVGDQPDRFYRVGTAWAVEPTTLVSSASVVMRMQALQDRFPQAVLFSPTTNQRIAITGTKVHPHYREAAAASDEAERKLDQLLASRDEASPTEIDREQLRKAWLDGRLEALRAAERQVYFDVATLSVTQPVEPRLTLSPAQGPDALRPNLAVRATGLAFDIKDPFFDPATAKMPWALEGRIGRLVSYEEREPRIERLIIHLEPPLPNRAFRGQLEYTYTGSPVVNERGQVIAIYSRPTPSAAVDKPPDGRSFDATLAQRVREVLALDE